VGAQHFLIPFQYGATGSAATLEQDTAAEVAQSVRVLLSTPTGTRVEQWDYGIPDVTFRDPRADAATISAAISRWEPRAIGTAVQIDVAADGSATVNAQIPARRQ
jgi:phage baseplate assembly protein W